MPMIYTSNIVIKGIVADKTTIRKNVSSTHSCKLQAVHTTNIVIINAGRANDFT